MFKRLNSSIRLPLIQTPSQTAVNSSDTAAMCVHIDANDCVYILKSTLGDDGFILTDFQLKRIDTFLGFHANYGRLKIRATIVSEDTEKEFNYFLKIENANSTIHEKYWKHVGHFYKERLFLTSLVSRLEEFAVTKITAKCHLSKPNECLIMEDLTHSGYELSRLASLDFAHSVQAVSAFANLHGSSIAFEERTGISIKDDFGHITYETLYVELDGISDCLMNSIDKGLRTVTAKYMSNWSEHDLDRLLSTIRRVNLTTLKETHGFRSTICQGDPWGGNILYNYDENGNPKKAILVDFGNLRYAPPALELMQFIYIETSKEFRLQFKSALENVYYERLTAVLSKNGVIPSQILSAEEFRASCDYCERFAVSTKVYYDYLTQLPENWVLKAASSTEDYLGLMIRGDARLPLDACERDLQYRNNLLSSLEEAFHFFLIRKEL